MVWREPPVEEAVVSEADRRVVDISSAEVTAEVAVVSADVVIRTVVPVAGSEVVAVIVVVIAAVVVSMKSSSPGVIFFRRSIFHMPKPTRSITQQLRASEARFM